MQSIFGALLTAGYAASFSSQIAASPEGAKVSEQVQNELTKSFASAANTAEQYPQYAQPIVHAARTSFLDGGDWTYAAGMIAITLGIAVVFFLFPKHERELSLLERYHAEDAPA
jgi:DHA2 family multidrug resistance protein-like MFS transporter